MEEETKSITDQFWDIVTELKSVEHDVAKFEAGNASAGVRLRHALRQTKRLAADLVKASSKRTDEMKEAKRAAKQA